MTRIVHLSDLHFGCHRTELVEPLLERVNRAGADLVVVTGDLTHRARTAQFRVARQFLSRLDAPVMAVPGNHDLPLFNLPMRLFLPFRRYRRAVDRDLTPIRQAGPLRVLGVNSADPLAVQRGVARPADLSRVAAVTDKGGMGIVALHHPLEHLPIVTKRLARRARRALDLLEGAGVRVVLSGHLHVWATDAVLKQTAHPGILQVQAGTALCARPSDRQNEFAVLDIEGPVVSIERHVAPMSEPRFRPPLQERFSLCDGIWQAHQPPEMPIVPIVPGATDTALSTA